MLFCLIRWGFLEVYTGPGYTDEEQAYTAGFVEGSPPGLGEPNMFYLNFKNKFVIFPGASYLFKYLCKKKKKKKKKIKLTLSIG